MKSLLHCRVDGGTRQNFIPATRDYVITTKGNKGMSFCIVQCSN